MYKNTNKYKKIAMAEMQIKDICDVIEEASEYHRNRASEFNMYKALIAMAASDVKLPSIGSVKEITRNIQEHYPEINLYELMDNVGEILLGIDDGYEPASIEVEDTIDSVFTVFSRGAGCTIEEIIDKIKKGIA